MFSYLMVYVVYIFQVSHLIILCCHPDNNNEVKVPSYLLSNIALKNKFNFKGFFLEVGLHVRNLLDEKYYDNIRTNAFGNRFYEPASLRSFILSIKTTF